MNQEEEKVEVEVPELQEASDSEDEEDEEPALVRLVANFDLFSRQVLEKLDALLEMKETVDKLFTASQWKKSKDAERKRQQRARDHEKRRCHLIPLPTDIWRRQPALRDKYLLWSHVGIQYGIIGDVSPFLSWLASDWNHNTYLKKPITRVSNRPNHWAGTYRHECTWTDMFGRDTGLKEMTFGEAKFWDFVPHVGQVLERMELMPDWPNVKKGFNEMIRLCASSFAGWSKSGLLQKGGCPDFEHNAPEIGKYPIYRAMATTAMQAFRKGICTLPNDEEPELVRMGILRSEDHKKQLLREQSILRFRYELKRGLLDESERDQIEGLRQWGFEPDVKQMKENIKRLAQLAAEEHLLNAGPQTKTV
jgi:hypothetical protein